MSGTPNFAMSAALRTGRSNFGPSPSTKYKPQPHRIGHGEDVGEQDRRVEIEARQRLQRDLAREIRVLRHRRKLPAFARVARYSGK
jgi:hypothetical protein